MSFFYGSLNKSKLIEFVQRTEKPIKYTYGPKFRQPTTLRVPVTVAEAVSIIEREDLLDAEELDDYIDLNAFSANDMW